MFPSEEIPAILDAGVFRLEHSQLTLLRFQRSWSPPPEENLFFFSFFFVAPFPAFSYFEATRVSIQHFFFLSTPKIFFFLKWGEISTLNGLKFGAAPCEAAFHKLLKNLYFSLFALIVISSIKKSNFQPLSFHQGFFFWKTLD